MSGRQRAIAYCLMAIAAGTYGVITLLSDMPPDGENRMWSVWLMMMYLCILVGGFGAAHLMQIVAPSDDDLWP